MNHNLTITVAGCTGSGKTLIQQYIAEMLRDRGITVDIEWGLDGNPGRSPTRVDHIIDDVAPLLHVKVKTQQLSRGSTYHKVTT